VRQSKGLLATQASEDCPQVHLAHQHLQEPPGHQEVAALVVPDVLALVAGCCCHQRLAGHRDLTKVRLRRDSVEGCDWG